MKTLKNYIVCAILIPIISFWGTSCSEDYDRSTDYSAYRDLKISIENLVNDTLLLEIGTEPKLSLDLDSAFTIQYEAFIYQIEDTSLVEIETNGKFVPKKRGVTSLNVSFRGNLEKTVSCGIKVWKDTIFVSDIELDFESTAVGIGREFNLASHLVVLPENAEFPTLKYVSKHPNLLQVSEEGVLKGIAEGSTIVTVSSTDGSDIVKEIKVEVVKNIPVTDITIPEVLKDATIPLNQSVDLNAIGFAVVPANAMDKDLSFEAISGNIKIENGVLTATAEGDAEFKVSSTDGTDISKVVKIKITEKSDDLSRLFWTVETSHVHIADGSTGIPQHMFDNSSTTFWSVAKPGKGSPQTPIGDIVNFIVDKKSNQEFNYLKWHHRSSHSSDFLRVWGVDILGSNDGKTFTAIKTGVAIPKDDNKNYQIIDIPQSNYRFVKVMLTKWSDNSGGSSSGTAMQIAEFGLGLK